MAWTSDAAPSQAVLLKLTDEEYGSHDQAKLMEVRQLLLDEANQDGPPCLILDLSEVRHFGASFAGILVATSNQLKTQNRRLALCGLNPVCAELIQVLRLDKVLDIYPTAEIALEEMDEEGRGQADEPWIMFERALARAALHAERSYNCRRGFCSQAC
jgi:anti-anti-sigma factor